MPVAPAVSDVGLLTTRLTRFLIVGEVGEEGEALASVSLFLGLAVLACEEDYE